MNWFDRLRYLVEPYRVDPFDGYVEWRGHVLYIENGKFSKLITYYENKNTWWRFRFNKKFVFWPDGPPEPIRLLTKEEIEDIKIKYL